MRVFDGKQYRDMTEAEIRQSQKMQQLYVVKEQARTLTVSEVIATLISQQVNSLTVDDNTALRMVEFYPAWTSGTAYFAAQGCPVGYKVSRNGKLWRLRQEHTSQIGWEPENVPTLWEQIVRSYSCTDTDPIPYEGNMRLENGKYYIQNDVIYLCNRDTGNPVYHDLTDLVSLYVEVIA